MQTYNFTLDLSFSYDSLAVNEGSVENHEEFTVIFDRVLKGDTGATGPQGATGTAGVGIASVAQNANYTLTITLTDGTTYTTSPIRGAQGEKGEKGDTGEQGATGATGATGNGIQSVVLNADYTLTINFTNGTSVTTASIRGAQGPAGQNGTNGQNGADGAPGPNVVSTATDSNITGLLKGANGKVAQAVEGVDYIKEHQSLGNYYTKAETDTAIAGHHDSTKQNTIADLAAIRSGAEKGDTAVQPEAGKGLFSGSYNDLSDKPTIPTVDVNKAYVDAGLAEKQNTIDASHKLDTSLVGITVSTSNPATLDTNKLYDLGEQSALAIALPQSASLGDFIIVDFLSGATATTLSISSSAGLSQYDLVPEANKIYKLFFNWNRLDASANFGWCVKWSEYEKAV